MTFHVGQKVVYIGPDFSSNPLVTFYGFIVPVPREIYTIRSYAPRVEGPGYLLNEIHNAEHSCSKNGLCELSINAEWLRPLVSRKTDISIFKRMLSPSKREVDA